MKILAIFLVVFLIVESTEAGGWWSIIFGEDQDAGDPAEGFIEAIWNLGGEAVKGAKYAWKKLKENGFRIEGQVGPGGGQIGIGGARGPTVPVYKTPKEEPKLDLGIDPITHTRQEEQQKERVRVPDFESGPNIDERKYDTDYKPSPDHGGKKKNNEHPKSPDFNMNNDVDLDPVRNVKVISRKLKSVPFRKGPVSHTGLLATTEKGRKIVVEYMDDSKVHVTNYEDWMKEYPTGKYKVEQKFGDDLPPEKKVSVDELKQMMQKDADSRGEYGLTKNNCHMAQQETRKGLGLEVKDSILDRKEKVGNFGENYRKAKDLD